MASFFAQKTSINSYVYAPVSIASFEDKSDQVEKIKNHVERNRFETWKSACRGSNWWKWIGELEYDHGLFSLYDQVAKKSFLIVI